MEAKLRERFGDDEPLLTPGLFRGSLWFQSASWALDYDDERGQSPRDRDRDDREQVEHGQAEHGHVALEQLDHAGNERERAGASRDPDEARFHTGNGTPTRVGPGVRVPCSEMTSEYWLASVAVASALLSGPGSKDMFRYRLHSPDGDDLGEATYAVMIKPSEEITATLASGCACSTSWCSTRRTTRTSRRSSGC